MKLRGTILEIERKGGVFNAILKVAFIPESDADTAHMISAAAGDDIELPEFDVNPEDDDADGSRLH